MSRWRLTKMCSEKNSTDRPMLDERQTFIISNFIMIVFLPFPPRVSLSFCRSIAVAAAMRHRCCCCCCYCHHHHYALVGSCAHSFSVVAIVLQFYRCSYSFISYLNVSVAKTFRKPELQSSLQLMLMLMLYCVPDARLCNCFCLLLFCDDNK